MEEFCIGHGLAGWYDAKLVAVLTVVLGFMVGGAVVAEDRTVTSTPPTGGLYVALFALRYALVP